MALRKRGVFYTFIAVIFLSLLIFSVSIGNNYERRERSFVIETRIDTMNKFLSDIQQDIERAAYIAGFRALIGLEDHIILNGEYSSNLDADFSELFFDGTINGENSSILINNTFNDWIEKIKDEADKIDIVVNFSVNGVSISQDDPWRVRVDVDIGMKMTDKKLTSRWEKEQVITSYVEIEGFEDPIYMLGTNGMAGNKIQRANYSFFVNGTDVSNLLNHCYNGYYVAFSGSPSYLMRLTGNFGSSEYGIESLVDLEDLASKGISVQDKSIIDAVYFKPGNPKEYHVIGAPSWFKLDNKANIYGNQSHHDLYEVNGLVE